MPDQPTDSEAIRTAGKAAIKRRRLLREMHRSEVAAPSPGPIEHYHIVYFHTRSDTTSTDWNTRYDRQRDAFLALKKLADLAEPNVEYYDDGQIGFETRIHGMLGQHWMLASVGLCTRRDCVRSRPAIITLIKPE